MNAIQTNMTKAKGATEAKIAAERWVTKVAPGYFGNYDGKTMRCELTDISDGPGKGCKAGYATVTFDRDVTDAEASVVAVKTQPVS